MTVKELDNLAETIIAYFGTKIALLDNSQVEYVIQILMQRLEEFQNRIEAARDEQS